MHARLLRVWSYFELWAYGALDEGRTIHTSGYLTTELRDTVYLGFLDQWR